MTTSISSLFAQSSPYESSIQQILRLEGLKKTQLQSEQNALRTQKSSLSAIDSKLSSLNTLLTSFKESGTEKFQPLTGESTDPGAVSIISTSGLKNPGSYSIEVTQLAKEDIMLSNAVSQTGSDLNATGTGSFEIAVGSGDPVSISVDTTGLNNQEVMEAIAAGVNDQLGDKVTASVFKLGDGTSKLSFKSTDTGTANRISVSNQQGDLAGLNLTNIFTTDELNAQFKMDEVVFERSSNLIDDVIDGFTFELNKETAGEEQMKITRNTEEAQKNVEEFISQFNALNDLIRSKTFLNGDTGDRGPLQNERSVRNLSYALRQTVTLPVDSLAGEAVYSLNSIGIDLEQDGTMKLEDSAKLTEALTSNPEGVAALFGAGDGIATSLQQKIEQYIADDAGIFDSLQDSFDRKIERLDDRIQREEEYLVQKEESLRAEFAELDKVISQGESQFNQILNFQSQYGF